MTSRLTYELLDSGAGAKLERFGEVVLERPSSLAIWPRKNKELWAKADGCFETKKGWVSRQSLPVEWPIEIAGVTMMLRGQTNGQLGLFPEHESYLSSLSNFLQPGSLVLNLFAYTGLASLVASKAGAAVTHVDLSKRCLDWTRQNLEASNISGSDIRLIPEDALTFLRRAAKRKDTFDAVILDPPTFSRVNDTKKWDLDEILVELLELVLSVTNQKRGLVLFSSHHYEFGSVVPKNVIKSIFPGARCQARQLLLGGESHEFPIPAGNLIIAALGDA